MSSSLKVPHREVDLPVELWFPATEAFRGRDLETGAQDRFRVVPAFADRAQQAVRDAEARAGNWPLLIFSHGYGGQRRQSTFLCTHLASRGFAVIAPDHVGNTALDLMAIALAERRGRPFEIPELSRLADAHTSDLEVLLEHFVGRTHASGVQIAPTAAGVYGHSIGGWVAMALGANAGVGACAGLGAANLPGLKLHGGGEVPRLFVAAEKDTIIPPASTRELARSVDGPTRMAVLEGAGHFHFCDDAERAHESLRQMPQIRSRIPWMGNLPPFSKFAPAGPARAATTALVAGFFAATLRRDPEARSWLEKEAHEQFGIERLD